MSTAPTMPWNPTIPCPFCQTPICEADLDAQHAHVFRAQPGVGGGEHDAWDAEMAQREMEQLRPRIDAVLARVRELGLLPVWCDQD